MKLSEICMSEFNVREGEYIQETVEDLAEAIKGNGLYSRLVLRKTKEGLQPYELISGGRRYLALKELHGGSYELPESDYILKEMDDYEALVDSICENVHRINLSPLQLGKAANKLKALKKGLSIKEIAKILWVPEARVKRVIGLQDDLCVMPSAVRDELNLTEDCEPRFTDAHWDALKKTSIDTGDEGIMRNVCDYIMENELPASKVGSVVDRFTPKEAPSAGDMMDDGSAPAEKPKDPNLVGEDTFSGLLTISPTGEVQVLGKKGEVLPFDLQYYLQYAGQSNYRVAIKAKFTIKIA